MKGYFILIAFVLCRCVANAQQVDIIYNGDSSKYVPKYISGPRPDQFPRFPGGSKAFGKFLEKTLIYPDKSGMIDVQGKVIISFIVEKDGRLTNFKVARKLYPIFDDEALRVMKLSPKWIPGKVNGKPVRCRHTIPINFVLAD